MRRWYVWAASFAVLIVAGCHTDMWKEAKVGKPLGPNSFFADSQSAREPVAHTVARGEAHEDKLFYTGILTGGRTPIVITNPLAPVETGIFRGTYVNQFPFPITKADLERGRERFDIYCAPCHGRLGDGHGMITQRGLILRKPPPSYHIDRLRNAPVGHFFDVITNGYGMMYSYAERIEPRDRWCIVAYIRALQLSQNAKPADVPSDQIKQLGGQQ